MRNRLDEYQVRAYALSWYSKSVLIDEDMNTIDSWYSVDEEEETEEAEEESKEEK